VKLLFDQNLSPLLAQRLQDIFPDSTHVFRIGLDRAVDLDIWQFSHAQEFTIVSRDSDFSDFSMVMGFPPKVLWIRRGNCST
jgi:predicted nuclease of predicted toxin-antitoxin system